ncbi:hypothetical protein N7533_005990 [Penicillium manginii]|uniref:uncharacterized protein n=1 Tax=Penicillium manginii TaxID=203109 RepID=UPI0025482865|nr:uncharacterized protein N7533_005990 [Penicillium manginii]KAJ5756447.1 hypothetical protein N7533_005990 [Penicillium manginii]
MEIKLDLRGVLRRTEPQDIPSRSLSYSGSTRLTTRRCWTCRERRTKCDERPAACRRCEDAKLVCAGYDIRLNWAEGGESKTVEAGWHSKVHQTRSV